MRRGFLFLKVNASIAAVLLLTFVVGGCGIPHRPTVVTISKTPPFRPSSPTDIHSVEQAFDAIITVCRNDLGLPTVDPLYIHLYRNTTSFALYGQGWRTLPLDVANLIAFTDGNTIHINLEKLGNYSWGDLVLVLAHEYAHVIEKSLPGPSHHVKLWFYEGFADWVGFKVRITLQSGH